MSSAQPRASQEYYYYYITKRGQGRHDLMSASRARTHVWRNYGAKYGRRVKTGSKVMKATRCSRCKCTNYGEPSRKDHPEKLEWILRHWSKPSALYLACRAGCTQALTCQYKSRSYVTNKTVVLYCHTEKQTWSDPFKLHRHTADRQFWC